VDFWASWCQPCKQSFPWLAKISRLYHDQGLLVVGICLDKSRTNAGDFLGANQAPFAVAFDPEGKVAEAFHVSAMPSSYLISRDGSIIYEHKGFDPKEADAFEARIKEACTR
jgi:cytochrome c biogenesis protein CcmG, thiol:disulfide interchange protein DsbE